MGSLLPSPSEPEPIAPAMMGDLIQRVERAAGLSPAQATLAVETMMRFLAARLPSPQFGELQKQLAGPGPVDPARPRGAGP